MKMQAESESSPCRRLRPMLGTFVAIEGQAADRATAERAVEAAYDAVRCVDERMHPTRPGSDLAKIHAAPVGRAVAVHSWTAEVLALSQQLHELSDGRFDPCLPERTGSIRDIDLSRPGCVVCKERVSIDLGGIAKGFAVDRAIDALREFGCRAGVVNAGGDVRVFGADGVTVWVRRRSGMWPITLTNEACAVSDPAQSERPAEHRGYYSRVTASIDPATAEPAVVVAPTAALADALTKCVLLSNARDVSRLLARCGAVSW